MNSAYTLRLRQIGFKRLNRLCQSTISQEHLLSCCTCAKPSSSPGPHHAQDCPCYATSKVALFQCSGVVTERRGRRRETNGLVKLVITEIQP